LRIIEGGHRTTLYLEKKIILKKMNSKLIWVVDHPKKKLDHPKKNLNIPNKNFPIKNKI